MPLRRRRPRYASKKRVAAFGTLLRDAVLIGEQLLAFDPSKPTAHLSRAYLAAALEAARGVLSEVEAGRPTNAIRLARHAYEYELQLEYVLDRPGVRLRQLMADDASRRLLAVRLVPGLNLRRSTVAAYQKIVDKAQEEARRRGWTKKGSPTQDGPILPSMEVMADIVDARRSGRKESYDLEYRGASSLSHPTLLGADTYLQTNSDGSVSIRDSTEDPIREIQALVTTTRALVDLLDTTNWQLGATLGAQIRAVAQRALNT